MTDASPEILVLGAGSAGARHARYLAKHGATPFLADPEPGRAAGVAAATAVPYDLAAIGQYDGVVIASPNSFHTEQALASVSAGRRTLVEKPMALSGTGARHLAEAGDGRLMVGYNLRLHRPVERLVHLVRDGRIGVVRSARLWFGSYLPAWRPGVDYRTTYSAQAALGGGVLLDATHELDLALWLFGRELTVVGAFVGRVGDLEIDVEDTVKCVVETPDGIAVEVSLDYLSRRYRRGIEVVGDTATIRLDWARSVLEIEDEHGIESEDASDPVDTSYDREAARFVSWLVDDTPPPVDGWEGAASIELADRIRAAAQ
jgi:predicted dehydrogenase